MARALVLLLAAGVGLLLGAGGTTVAALSDSQTAEAGEFTAGRLISSGAPTVTVTNFLNGGRRISWSAATVDGGGRPDIPVDGYRVLRYASATGGTGTEVCSTTTQLTCDVTGQPQTAYYSVVAAFATWTAESARSVPPLGDLQKPTVSFTFPFDGYSAKSKDVDNEARQQCGKNVVACGTATDNIGVSGVTYQLQRRVGTSFLNYTYACWNGMSWIAGQCGTTFRSAVLTTSGTTRTWELPGKAKDAYDNNLDAAFILTVRAVDAAGNTSDGGLLGGTPRSITFATTRN